VTAPRCSFDRVAAVYDRTRAMPDSAAAAVTAGIVRAIGSTGAAPRLLEVGIGTGRIAVPLAAAGIRVFGVDVALAMLARLHEKASSVDVVVGDAAALPFAAGRFDAVLLVHVLHLVSDALAVTRAARAVVRPGGVVLLGRTEYAPGMLHRLRETLWRVVAELGGPTPSATDWHAAGETAFATAAREVGAAVDECVLARWTEMASGRRLLDDLAARTYSSMWAIPDALMAPLLARLEPALRALVGDLDRPIETDATFVLVAAHLP
jgi:SAM-dependent methyltransferase